MNLTGLHIGFGLTGSHCTYSAVIPEMKKLVAAGAKVTPFVTYTVNTTDTKFGASEEWLSQIKEITKEEIVDSIVKAEPFGPRTPLD